MRSGFCRLRTDRFEKLDPRRGQPGRAYGTFLLIINDLMHIYGNAFRLPALRLCQMTQHDKTGHLQRGSEARPGLKRTGNRGMNGSACHNATAHQRSKLAETRRLT
jgi:hypothetical protein